MNSAWEIVQNYPLAPSSYCYRCRHLLKSGDMFVTVAKDLRRPGWGKFNRKLKADHTMWFKSHVAGECK